MRILEKNNATSLLHMWFEESPLPMRGSMVDYETLSTCYHVERHVEDFSSIK